MTRLLVVGAGPKALALAAKAAVLNKLFPLIPDLIVLALEKKEIAAHWKGEAGFTDGSPFLGTPPEKDIGFPYSSTAWGEHSRTVDDKMLAYSWHRYSVLHSKYRKWVDQGRPQPKHKEWAHYLNWVATEVGLQVQYGRVELINLREGKWDLTYRDKDQNEQTIMGDGLVITGPGVPNSPYEFTSPRRFLNAVTFWEKASLKQFDDADGKSICVIGVGETAASIVCALLDRVRRDCAIEIVSPEGVIFSRGENYFENTLFSDATEWQLLSKDHRDRFIRRTDHGVFSQQALQKINTADNIRRVPGKVKQVRDANGYIEVLIQYGVGPPDKESYDFVIDAANINLLSFVDLLAPPVRKELEDKVGTIERRTLEASIDKYLGVSGLQPRLHLPMLAGLEQGPGFPNLSCLGLLSDAILKPYF